MAYQSNESGQSQIHVQAIPASGGKYQVSTSGGTQPAWRRDGKELYYLSTDQKLMAVPITVGTSVTPGTPQPLFARRYHRLYTLVRRPAFPRERARRRASARGVADHGGP